MTDLEILRVYIAKAIDENKDKNVFTQADIIIAIIAKQLGLTVY